ncbi:MAG: aspartyl/asparaginyl beta-hydroxylase domain-containing protein [Pseudomonadota bacterium]
MAAWIAAIPFADWPQQTRLTDGQLRPAMVSDLAWHGFGEVTEELVRFFGRQLPWMPYNRLLSVVMPGAGIDPHRDQQAPEWITRVHVPLLTNKSAWLDCGGKSFNLKVGYAYEVNTEAVHAARNEGETPRVHLMIDYKES